MGITNDKKQVVRNAATPAADKDASEMIFVAIRRDDFDALTQSTSDKPISEQIHTLVRKALSAKVGKKDFICPRRLTKVDEYGNCCSRCGRAIEV